MPLKCHIFRGIFAIADFQGNFLFFFLIFLSDHMCTGKADQADNNTFSEI